MTFFTTIHQTHHMIYDFDNIFNYLKLHLHENARGLHIFPELFLTGYPLKDLVFQRHFIRRYFKLLDEINNWLKFEAKGDWAALVGGPSYNMESNSTLPRTIRNGAYKLTPGDQMDCIYEKRLLPNYDIFDEGKYFDAGKKVKIWDWNGLKILPLICEDMWPSSFHALNPVNDVEESIDIVVNLSASPFFVTKHDKRIQRAKEVSTNLNAPIIYVNRVGGEDDVLFDGGSFVLHKDNILYQAPHFQECFQEIEIELDPEDKNIPNKKEDKNINTWEHIFDPAINLSTKPLTLIPWTENQVSIVEQAIMFGIKEYAIKNNFNKFLVGVSGGIDSAVVLGLLHNLKHHLHFPCTIHAIFMPSKYTSSQSIELAQKLCKGLNIPLNHFPIKFLHSTMKKQFEDYMNGLSITGLADENIQSRLRGILLYAFSNIKNCLVINTSNKSEIAVGYSTMYGDSIGALSPLGDLYKTQVYSLARHLNCIPEEIITRAPSAELREDQKDSQSLPPYEILDTILEGLLSYRLDDNDLIDYGLSKKYVKQVSKLFAFSQYKRHQFPPIIKIHTKSFGYGYRHPISYKKHF